MRIPFLRLIALVVVALVVAASGCGGGGTAAPDTTSPSTDAEESTTTGAETDAAEADEDDVTLLPGQTAGLDDFNDDGELDPTCGMQDFGAGLVLRILCDIGGRNSEPPEGVTLLESSLFRLPTDDTVDLAGISAWAVVARDDAGARVYVIIFQSDALFATGSDVISDTNTFDNLVALINRQYAGSTLQIRGHTDSTGSPDSNQSLSEQRAASVQTYLTDHGVDAAEVTTVGMGQSQPLAIEDNDAGLKFNRRVEVVIRPPA